MCACGAGLSWNGVVVLDKGLKGLTREEWRARAHAMAVKNEPPKATAKKAWDVVVFDERLEPDMRTRDVAKSAKKKQKMPPLREVKHAELTQPVLAVEPVYVTPEQEHEVKHAELTQPALAVEQVVPPEQEHEVKHAELTQPASAVAISAMVHEVEYAEPPPYSLLALAEKTPPVLSQFSPPAPISWRSLPSSISPLPSSISPLPSSLSPLLSSISPTGRFQFY
jgi:hypothetical protein